MARIYHLAKTAFEEGTYGVKFTFKDENGSELDATDIPTLYWWLSDVSGGIVNGRSQVEVTSITNPYTVVMSGDDLQIINKQEADEKRILTVKGTYNSDLGNDLPFVYSVSFDVRNILVIAADLFVSVIDMIFTTDTADV